LGVVATDLMTVLHHNIAPTEPDSPPVTMWNWMILLPYQLRAYHRANASPSSIQSSDDTSEDNKVDDVSPTNLLLPQSVGFENRECYKACSLPIAYIPSIVPLPKSLTWIKLRDNYRVDDQTVLRYIPYFGDDDTIGFDMSAYEFVPWELEGDIGGEVIERTVSTIMGKYQHVFENEENGDEQRKEIEKNTEGNGENDKTHPSPLESALMKLFSLSVTQLRQAKKHGDMYSDLISTNINSTNQILIPSHLEQKLITRYGSPTFLPLFLRSAKENYSPQLNDIMLNDLGYRNKPDYKSVAENYLDMFCRRCYKYDCRTHGIEQPRQRQHEDPLDILVVNENGAIITETQFNRRTNKRKKSAGDPSNSVANGKGGSDETEDVEKFEEVKDGGLESSNSNMAQSQSMSNEFYQTSDGNQIPYGMYQKAVPVPPVPVPVPVTPNPKKRKSSAAAAAAAAAAMATSNSTPIQLTPPEYAVAARLRDMMFLSDPSLMEEMQQKQSSSSSSSQQDLPFSIKSKIAFLLGTCQPQDISDICARAGGATVPSGAKKQNSTISTNPKESKNKKRSRAIEAKDLNSPSDPLEISEVAREDETKAEAEKITGPLFNLGTALTNIRKDGFSLVHQPCDHEGPCVLGICECVDSTGYCETDCACSSSCKNRFQGCKCTPGQCRTLL
jgi:hypothetical protein